MRRVDLKSDGKKKDDVKNTLKSSVRIEKKDGKNKSKVREGINERNMIELRWT